MTIGKDNLQEFKKIYLEQFGTELSEEQTLEYALALVNFLKVALDSNTKTVGKI